MAVGQQRDQQRRPGRPGPVDPPRTRVEAGAASGPRRHPPSDRRRAQHRPLARRRRRPPTDPPPALALSLAGRVMARPRKPHLIGRTSPGPHPSTVRACRPRRASRAPGTAHPGAAESDARRPITARWACHATTIEKSAPSGSESPIPTHSAQACARAGTFGVRGWRATHGAWCAVRRRPQRRCAKSAGLSGLFTIERPQGHARGRAREPPVSAPHAAPSAVFDADDARVEARDFADSPRIDTRCRNES